ncbi:mitochondrial carrier domain-containing protein [Flagelloscypha sp. PMI_526]|nr:mitochondrial carrier domain-containing protein [Flagelloscypha sp. PMI_526]
MTSALPPLIQALAGASGSSSANVLTYPLDLVTTRLQLDRSKSLDPNPHNLAAGFRLIRSIVRKDGLYTLYTGLSTDTAATFISNWIRRKFTLHAGVILLERGSHNRHNYHPNLLQEVVLGFLAGVASRALSTPLNLVTLKLQQEQEQNEGSKAGPKKIRAVMRDIYQKHGLAGFWKGFGMTALCCLNPSLTMAFFQVLRRLIEVLTRSKRPLSPREAFFVGAISSSISSFLLYPLILAKTRLQATSATSIQEVWQEGSEAGVAGLYQALQMQLLKGFLSQGVTFNVKGRIEQLVVAAYRYRRSS